MTTKELHAIINEDVENFLKSIDEYERVVNGKAICNVCGKPITFENIYQILPRGSKVEYCCNEKDCILQQDKGEGNSCE